MNNDSKITPGLISIITIVLNGVDYIEETIISVISQKDVNLEYIIIDGGSNDGTLRIIEKYRKDISVIVSESDEGLYEAINKGIKLAKGELIGLIHCGDKYEQDILNNCYRIFIKSKSDVIYGKMNALKIINDVEILQPQIPNHKSLKNKMSIFHPATLISQKCYAANGLYNPKYRIAADYDFFLRIFLAGASFEYFPMLLATFRAGGSSSNTLKTTKELFLIWKTYLGQFIAIRNATMRLFNYWYYTYRKIIAVSFIGTKNYNNLILKKNKMGYPILTRDFD